MKVIWSKIQIKHIPNQNQNLNNSSLLLFLSKSSPQEKFVTSSLFIKFIKYQFINNHLFQNPNQFNQSNQINQFNQLIQKYLKSDFNCEYLFQSCLYKISFGDCLSSSSTFFLWFWNQINKMIINYLKMMIKMRWKQEEKKILIRFKTCWMSSSKANCINSWHLILSFSISWNISNSISCCSFFSSSSSS